MRACVRACVCGGLWGPVRACVRARACVCVRVVFVVVVAVLFLFVLFARGRRGAWGGGGGYVGRFCCFYNPQNSDIDYTIFTVCK